MQDGNSRALVTGRSLFRRPLSRTTFLPTSHTADPSHSLKLLLKPSFSFLHFLSYLDPLEDLFLFVLFSWTAVVCVADMSVNGRESYGRRDGVRMRERGRERLGEREL